MASRTARIVQKLRRVFLKREIICSVRVENGSGDFSW